MTRKSIEKRAAEALVETRRLADRKASWIELHNAIFGIGGIGVRLFPSERERVAFSRTDEHAQILGMIDSARGASDPLPAAERANGRVLMRLPRSIHAALIAEADAEGVSLNQLCLAKLSLQLRARV